MNKKIGALLVLISEASLRPRVGWPMACHSCFRPDEVGCVVKETLAISVFYALSQWFST